MQPGQVQQNRTEMKIWISVSISIPLFPPTITGASIDRSITREEGRVSRVPDLVPADLCLCVMMEVSGIIPYFLALPHHHAPLISHSIWDITVYQ